MPEVKARKAARKKKETKAEEAAPVRDPEVPVATETAPVEAHAEPEPEAEPTEPEPAKVEEPKAEKPKEAPKPEPPKPVEAKPALTPKPVQGKLVTTPGGVKKVFQDGPNPRILAKVAASLMGINPRDARFFLEHLTSTARKDAPFVVCIRCGTYVPKPNMIDRFRAWQAVLDMREVMPRFHHLTNAVWSVDLPKKYINDKTTGVNGFCPRCILEMGSAMPSMFRIPEVENEDAPELRSLILDVIQQQRIQEAIILLRRLLEDRDE